MKTKKLSVLLLSVLFLGSNFMTSCSSEETQAIQTNSSKTLLKNLENFNHSNEFKNLKCDGFWNCLGDVMVVAGADVVAGAGAASGVQSVAAGAGAATGGTGWVVVTVGAGVIGGAGASVATARALDSDDDKEAEAKSSGKVIELPSEFSDFSQAGIDHNIVVSNILNGKSIYNYYQYKGISQKYIDILESPEVNKIYSDLETASINYANNKFDYKSLTQDCVNFKLLNNNTKQVLDLFLEKYLTCSSFSDIETVVNFYTKEVNKSNLRYEEKSALIIGFMIANESPAQWLRN